MAKFILVYLFTVEFDTLKNGILLCAPRITRTDGDESVRKKDHMISLSRIRMSRLRISRCNR